MPPVIIIEGYRAVYEAHECGCYIWGVSPDRSQFARLLAVCVPDRIGRFLACSRNNGDLSFLSGMFRLINVGAHSCCTLICRMTSLIIIAGNGFGSKNISRNVHLEMGEATKTTNNNNKVS